MPVISAGPNPVSNFLHVKFNGFAAGKIVFKLSDENGKIVWTSSKQNDINGEQQFDISFANFVAGNYILTADDSENNHYAQKIIK